MERMYTKLEVMGILHVGEQALSEWCRNGEISYRKVGNKHLFAQADLDEFTDRAKRNKSGGKDKRAKPPEPVKREKMYTQDETLGILCIAPQTLAQWCSNGKISYRKIGRKRFFSQADLDEFFERNKRSAV